MSVYFVYNINSQKYCASSMPQTQLSKLPLIKQTSFAKKNTLSISKIQKAQSNSKRSETQRWKRKISLNCRDGFTLQKRCLSQKRFSLKKITTEKKFKTLKLSQKNTDDNSESDKNCETFEEIKIGKIQTTPIVTKAVDMLRMMTQVDKVAKLYKKNSQKTKNSENVDQNRKILKNKYKCLINPHVFDRKPKHNNSDETSKAKSKKQKIQPLGFDFWDKINESLILESSRPEEPSRQLVEIVQNFLTE